MRPRQDFKVASLRLVPVLCNLGYICVLSVCLKVMDCHATSLRISVLKRYGRVIPVDLEWMEAGGTANAVIAT